MELKLWSPFSDVEREWHLDLPRIFGEGPFAFRPSMDVVKDDDGLTVTAELPGIDPEKVEVTIDGSFLLIKGEKSEEREISEDKRYLRERSYGKFQRRVPLPDGTDADSVAARVDNGVLTVHVDVREATADEPRRIPVEVG